MLDYAKLVPQGRAKAHGQPWSAEELELLIALEKERDISRKDAADYIRNGIESLEDFDRAQKAGFEPLDPEKARIEAEQHLADRAREAIGDIDATKGAEKLAKKHGIKLSSVEGSGADGRILKSDVQSVVTKKQ